MKKVKQYHTVGTVLKIKYQNRRNIQKEAKLIPKAHMTAQFLTLLYVLKYKVMD